MIKEIYFVKIWILNFIFIVQNESKFDSVVVAVFFLLFFFVFFFVFFYIIG